MHRLFSFSKNSIFSPSLPWRLDWLLRGNALSMLATILLSFPAWTESREYPLLPLIPLQLVFPWDHALIIFILLLLGLLIAGFHNPYVINLTIAGISFELLLDQSRIMPYTLTSLFFLLLFAFYLHGNFTPKTTSWIWLPARLFMAALHFYAGLHKINTRFLHYLGPWILSSLGLANYSSLGTASRWTMLASAYMALFECTAGALLLWPRYQKVAALFLIAMHSLILFVVLGPLSAITSVKTIVPWNVLCILTLAVAFLPFQQRLPLHRPLYTLLEIVAHRWNRTRQRTLWALLAGTTFLLWGVMPFFYLWHAWPAEISFGLFNGNLPEAALIFKKEQIPYLPPHATMRLKGRRLAFGDWTETDLNAEPCPDEVVYYKVAQKLAAQLPGKVVRLEIYRLYRPWDPGLQVLRMDCHAQ